VGTAKRERQKAGRQARLEQLQREQKKQRTTHLVRNGALIVAGLVVVAFILSRFVGGGSSSTAATTTLPSTTAVPASSTPPTTAPFAFGTGACPAADGSSPKTRTFTAAPKQCIDPTKSYTAAIETNLGSMTVALDPKAAPGTVNNFVVLARFHYFDATTCHRIIPGFVAQCGDPTATGTGGPGYTIADELPAQGAYQIGSLAMANSGPNTNGSQFFIITGAQGAALPPNYSLFGKVTSGLTDTVPALDKAGNPNNDGVPPLQTVTITKVTITES